MKALITLITRVVALAAIVLVPRSVCAREYYDAWVAPAQTDIGPCSASNVQVGTTPYTGTAAAYSTMTQLGPVRIASAENKRVAIYVENITTFTTTPGGNIEIVIGTSPVTSGYDVTVANQGIEDVAYSSNTSKRVHQGAWVLAPYSTTSLVDITAGNYATGAIGFSSNTVINPNYRPRQGTPLVKGNAISWPGTDMLTYRGALYASVYQTTFGVAAIPTNLGRVNVKEICGP